MTLRSSKLSQAGKHMTMKQIRRVFDDNSRIIFVSSPEKHAECGSSIRCTSAWYGDGRGFDLHVQQHSFMEIGHEIISMACLSS